MPNAWMTHVKKTRSLMGGKPIFKRCIETSQKNLQKKWWWCSK